MVNTAFFQSPLNSSRIASNIDMIFRPTAGLVIPIAKRAISRIKYIVNTIVLNGTFILDNTAKVAITGGGRGSPGGGTGSPILGEASCSFSSFIIPYLLA